MLTRTTTDTEVPREDCLRLVHSEVMINIDINCNDRVSSGYAIRVLRRGS
jgi:hypothetical protein